MKKNIITTVVLFWCCILSVYASSRAESFNNRQLKSILTRYLNKQRDHSNTSAIQASVRLPGSDRVVNASIGTIGKYSQHAISNRSVFAWGSVTKTFVAAVVLQLASENKINLNENLEYYFPEKFSQHRWPDAWRMITVKQLLNMTSDLPDYIVDVPWRFAQLTQHWNASHLLTKLVQLHSNAHPGIYHYSNTNYLLLSMLVKQATHKSLDYWLQTIILNKLPANEAEAYYATNYLPTQLVSGYYGEHVVNFNIASNSNVRDVSFSIGNAAAGMSGNTSALVGLLDKLFSGKLISKAATQMLLNDNYVSTFDSRPIHSGDNQCVTHACYGNGVYMYDYPKLGKEWVYEGKYFGYRTLYVYEEKLRVTIAISVNSSVPAKQDDLINLAREIL